MIHMSYPRNIFMYLLLFYMNIEVVDRKDLFPNWRVKVSAHHSEVQHVIENAHPSQDTAHIAMLTPELPAPVLSPSRGSMDCS